MASVESQRVRATLVNSRDSVGRPVAAQRQQWEDAVRDSALPLAVQVTPVELGGMSGEWIVWSDRQPSGQTILWLHGGGFTAGSSITHRQFAAQLAQVTSARVLTTNYRLAPEAPFPAAVEDALTAYRWLLDQGLSAQQIAVGGDSAGAALALGALVQLRDHGVALPCAVVLLSPWVDLALTGASLHAKIPVDPLTSREGLQAAASYYLSGHDPHDPIASPLYADLRQLPPLLIQAGDHEVLLDDAIRLAERARQAGVDVELDIWDEMWHVWQAWAAEVPEGQAALVKVAKFIRRQARARDA